MKNFVLFFLFYSVSIFSAQSDSLSVNKIPDLIPQKINGNFGYVNHKSKFVIAPKYNLAMFFNTDCNLLNSKNKKVRPFGSADFATVEENKIAYRIDKKGKKVYKYLKQDLATCPVEYKAQKYKAYIMQGFYGLVDKDSVNEGNYKDFVIYPQFQRLHVMEGNDIDNPMIVAVYNNKFGVIDKNAKVIIPFIYADIKLNFSWLLGKMFEVSVDNKEYFYVDENNVAY
ncbi:WG repeat-containing protein [Halpernia frigidisoli]|uniref:WG containing repeat-containing protein n=1 Tax=Halpernia frigidisoli TaxID=1125876 RepID=A0A1I3I4G9_9FLAO|nr:WG repeat-containing protein [Halpernia frigidisoli]SFI42885.1 WG containing repeat-containing protein [Halpernia frigidisoli]